MTEPRKASLLVIFLTVFIDLLGFGMVLPLLPLYAKDFAEQLGWEPNDWKLGLLIGLLMSSFSIMQFIFAPLWGRLSDRIGRRPVLMVGLATSMVCYALFGVATVLKSLTLVFVSRIGAGIGGATISTAQAYIADATDLKGRAKGMAMIGAAFGLGFTFGPMFGYLAVPSGKGDPGPGPGYAAAALSAVALALAFFKLPESLRPGTHNARTKWFDTAALRLALSTPGVGPLMLTIFVFVFSFANLESTLSLLVADDSAGHAKQVSVEGTQPGAARGDEGPVLAGELAVGYAFDFQQVCLTFAFIGIVLALVQGGIVRRVSGRINEVALATFGAAVEVVGFFVLSWAAAHPSVPLLLTGLAIAVSGFAFVTPSLNSLLSRWSDPARQGAILGIGQSLQAMARILGPVVGVTLIKSTPLAERLGLKAAELPLLLAGLLTLLSIGLILLAAKHGRDFVPVQTQGTDG